MQVPERLALIGGSILLSSTLVFTLKSQASSIIPNVSHSISGVFNHIGDASDFDNDYQQAQKKGWQNGNWGSAKFYVDDQHNMYVGSGELQGNALRSILGDETTDSLHTLNIEQPVTAPQDSNDLFSTSQGDAINNSNLEIINGLDKVDMSNAVNMHNVFSNDTKLKQINDISNWNTGHAGNLAFMFNNTNLANSDLHRYVSHWDTRYVTDTTNMFNANDKH